MIRQSDSGTAQSQAAFYAPDLEAGDLLALALRRADTSCFVRYDCDQRQSGSDGPTGDPPRKLLAVAWMTYAFTGCSGPISFSRTTARPSR